MYNILTMQIVVNNTLTHYLEFNSKAKNTLLILPGWGHSSAQWTSLVPLLNPHFRYILLDLPGFGGTAYLTGDPSVPQYAEFVTAFIKKLKLNSPWILGHSFGGQIATYLAIHQPKLANHYLLLSPAGIRAKTSRQKTKSFILRHLKPLRILLPGPLFHFFQKRFSSTDYLNASLKHRAILSQIVRQDYSSQLSQIKTPTDILWGEFDHEIPYYAKTMTNAILHARLHVLYGADHNPQLKKPQDLADTINYLLKNTHAH